ncbi:hypothetical protein ACFE04_006100 [Oxalis oulophora]
MASPPASPQPNGNQPADADPIPREVAFPEGGTIKYLFTKTVTPQSFTYVFDLGKTTNEVFNSLGLDDQLLMAVDKYRVNVHTENGGIYSAKMYTGPVYSSASASASAWLEVGENTPLCMAILCGEIEVTVHCWAVTYPDQGEEESTAILVFERAAELEENENENVEPDLVE